MNIILNLHNAASKDNSVDSPFRVSSDLDCSLTNRSWRLVEAGFGPHTFDLMALPSNAMKSSYCEWQTFFSPFSSSESSDVNVFSQTVDEKYYVFPPFILIGPLLGFPGTFGSIRVTTIIAPDVSPTRFWWPLLEFMMFWKIKIGSRAQKGIVVFPTKAG